MSVNFDKKICDTLINHGYDITDIPWIGNLEYCLNITNFFEKADKCDYNNGFRF